MLIGSGRQEVVHGMASGKGGVSGRFDKSSSPAPPCAADMVRKSLTPASPAIPPDASSSALRKSLQHYSNTLYANKVLRNLNNLRKDQKFCDVELAAGNKVIKVSLIV